MPASRTRRAALGLSAAALAITTAAIAPGAQAAPVGSAPRRPAPQSRACPPAAVALGFSDSLDKLIYHGTQLGGLSSLAYDRRAHAWVSAVDNHASDPSRIWFFRDLAHPQVVRDPLVLKRPDGTPYDGTTADNEGLAVLPDGNYLVSSETEPSIRIFGRDGVQRASLPVPARFAVTGTTPAGRGHGQRHPGGADHHAVRARGHRGDGGCAVRRRVRDRRRDLSPLPGLPRRPARSLDGCTEQISYRAESGQRVPEVAAYSDGALARRGGRLRPGHRQRRGALRRHRPRPRRATSARSPTCRRRRPATPSRKQLVADLVKCPTLGATSKETQTNPLLDNFEGMAITGRAPAPHLRRQPDQRRQLQRHADHPRAQPGRPPPAGSGRAPTLMLSTRYAGSRAAASSVRGRRACGSPSW